MYNIILIGDSEYMLLVSTSISLLNHTKSSFIEVRTEIGTLLGSFSFRNVLRFKKNQKEGVPHRGLLFFLQKIYLE